MKDASRKWYYLSRKEYNALLNTSPSNDRGKCVCKITINKKKKGKYEITFANGYVIRFFMYPTDNIIIDGHIVFFDHSTNRWFIWNIKSEEMVELDLPDSYLELEL